MAKAMFAYSAIDAATHLAEELSSPSKNIPKAMILTVFLGFLTAYPLVYGPSKMILSQANCIHVCDVVD